MLQHSAALGSTAYIYLLLLHNTLATFAHSYLQDLKLSEWLQLLPSSGSDVTEGSNHPIYIPIYGPWFELGARQQCATDRSCKFVSIRPASKTDLNQYCFSLSAQLTLCCTYMGYNTSHVF
jgi:hypothetical protein